MLYFGKVVFNCSLIVVVEVFAVLIFVVRMILVGLYVYFVFYSSGKVGCEISLFF